MSEHVNNWAKLEDHGNHGGNAFVTVFPSAVNWGRFDKPIANFYINGSNDECQITAEQEGHEFIEFEENLEPYEPNNIDYFHNVWEFFFESNSKYLSVSFAEGSHFALNDNRLLVDTDYDGTYVLYTLDASGEIEITDDPGQYDKYRVLVGLKFPQNNTGSDIADTLTIRGFSASGAQGQTLTISLVHKAAPVV